jgi:hypothetical protein
MVSVCSLYPCLSPDANYTFELVLFLCPQLTRERTIWFVYLQLNKKKAKAEGKKCHAKTMWSQ